MDADSDIEVEIVEDTGKLPLDHEEVDVVNVDDGVRHPSLNEVSLFKGDPNLANVRLLTRKIQKQVTVDSNEPDAKRPRISIDSVIPSVNFSQFRGFPKVLKDISELLVHIKEGKVYKSLGVVPPRGILLHGPPGCGKTLLAKAVAGELGIPLLNVSGPDLLPSIYGFFDCKIKNVFDMARQEAPCIIFIDKIDVIAQRREFANKLERKVADQLLACFDELSEAESNAPIMVIGETAAPESLDPAFRLAGRFDREVRLDIPDAWARKEILQFFTLGMKLESDISFEDIAELTPGFVGADLKSLATEAAIAAIARALEGKMQAKNSEQKKSEEDYFCFLKTDEPILTNEDVENLVIQNGDFLRALKTVQPSTKREGFVTVTDVTWDDVGSLQDVRSQLQTSILLPVKHPEEFSMLGITRPTGILLCGPPGCGKTLLAKAIANEGNINFMSVKGPELLSMYVGESEKAVRKCFQRAKTAQPCIIFFDEIDSLCPKRSQVSEGNNIIARVLNQILTEMDGIEERRGVFLLGATNRPDILDPAVLRPGRFDKVVFVGLPSAADRVDILKALTKNGTKPPMPGIDLDVIGKDPLLDGYTGADLAALVKESSVHALTQYMDGKIDQLAVTSQMMLNIAGKLRPSVSCKELKFYNKMKAFFGERMETTRSIGVP